MIFLQLFITFFEIGLFGFGGGYAMISLIQGQVVTRYHWMSMSEFTNVIAISQMTPGPIGINSATYSGYTAIHNAGHGAFLSVLGSAISTFALILPSLILMILICKLFMKYMHTNAVQLFLFTFVGTMYMKINPIRLIGYAGIAGLLLLY